jgi:methylmalonyl-CoA mutase C-terminal domain/subunit
MPDSLSSSEAKHALSAAEGERPIRVLIAKPGLDGHDRGAKVVARALRDAGMEVIYTGIRQTPEMIAEAALQEDVDVIGLSILSGAHLELFPRVVQALKDRAVDPAEVLLFAGGIIPDEDIPELQQLGFRQVYRPGASTRDIIDYVRSWVNERRAGAATEGGAAGPP